MANLPRASAALKLQLSSFTPRPTVSISRSFQTLSSRCAIAHPITAHGPPPKAPEPAPEFGQNGERPKLGRKEIEAQAPSLKKPSLMPKKRFWKDVHVVKKPEGDHQVLLDTRPVRTQSKEILSIPSTKPQLAHAIALEWDVMTSAQQALKTHLIPLTSLAARATDIAREDAEGQTTTREQIVKTAMRYLETDTLLCWVPQQRTTAVVDKVEEDGEKHESLRDIQMRVAKDIISFLSARVWPGVEIVPILDADSILPVSQPQMTKEIIRGWVSGLTPHDLAALERGILASKSLLVAVRLLVEWSENFRHVQMPGPKTFGIEEAAEASSLEVRWQTDMWGEVEDTHDVDKEDLKRQLGSVIVMVSGETR